MIRNRFLSTVITGALLAGLPSAGLAQDEDPGLEQTDWSLVTLYDQEQGEFVTVPFEVQPTLRLEDGVASGFGGCNDFDGRYMLNGSNVDFDDQFAVTNMFCEGPAQQTEVAYLAALPEVGSWAVDGSRLELYDNLGDLLLAFEVPGVDWTPTQLAALLGALEDLRTEIDLLRDDTDALNVPRLRERIKALEKENKSITKRLEQLEDAPDPGPNTNTARVVSFNKAEKVLLKGIPDRITGRCAPLRSQLPKGTQAAVTCQPNSAFITSVDYFLLEGSRAATEFGSVMQSYNVPETAAGGQSCADGAKSQSVLIGNGWQAEGCFRENKVAQLRFIDNATDCKKLRVDGRVLDSPAIYMALQAADQNVAKAHAWATKGAGPGTARMTRIAEFIPSNAAASPACIT